MHYLSEKNRTILYEMVRTDFKVRYQGSVLGYFWSLLKPLFLFAILYIVFTFIIPLGKDVAHYPVYLLLGIVMWNFFTEATMQGASSVVARGDLIRKIAIPRYLVVVASSLSALINLGLGLVVVIIFALFNGIMPSFSWLLIIPLVAELYIFALGCSFLLATLFVRFRDITYIWEIILQAAFYASAIIFPLVLVPAELHKWFFLNPIVQIIQDARWALATDTSITIWGTIHSWVVIVPFAIIAFITTLGYWYFKKRARYFAEDI